MGKSVADAVLDAALNEIRNTCTRMTVCNAEPTTFAQANATFALADVTMATGDFAIANGDTSGRKLTVAAKSGIPVDVAGTGNHIALLDVAGSRLLYVTTCPARAVTVGDTVNTAAWDIEIADPA